MKKIITVTIFVVMSIMLMTGAVYADDTVSVFTLKGPTGIGMVKLINENDGTYEFTLCGSPEETVAAIVSGNADIAAVPTNLAAVLYNKTEGNVQMIAINTLGVLSILENGNEIAEVSDLAGKTIYATGQGSTPEYVLDYILKANGLQEKVDVVYYGEHSELAALAAAGKVDIVMLPEPHATSVLMQNNMFRTALDITQLYSEAAEKNGQQDVEMSMGCVVVRKEFAEKNPEKVSDFLSKYQASVEFVNTNTDEAASMVEQNGIMPNAKAASKAIPNCHIVFIAGDEMHSKIQPFLQMLYDANPKSVGGKMPGDDFYYVK